MSNRASQCKALAVFGTASDVGKSVVATALCRVFSNMGVSVAPFKAQNMSNNSWVTRESGEMGRAQIVQAQAARVEPHVDMNPVLLKPASDTGSQVVLHGKPIGNREAREYFGDTDFLFQHALESLGRLKSRYDLVVIEGAGSCAEVNLRPRDFVNMRTAHAADAPVLLVGDIDRGGIFAQLVGTLDVLDDADRSRIKGFIINRFRGDASLFDDGITYIEQRTGLPVLGLVPFFYHIDIESEDGLPLDVVVDPPNGPAPDKVNIAVIRLPHISNFTDFAPLCREPNVDLHYLARPRSLEGYDVLLLPGTKNVRFDMEWLRSLGWVERIARHVQAGGRLVGVCGGYQMLGRVVRDPNGVEGDPGDTPMLGLLDLETELQGEKTLCRAQGTHLATGQPVEGYEIHMGVTSRAEGVAPAIQITSRDDATTEGHDGARCEDGRVWGTYCHGLFDAPGFRNAFLAELRPDLDRASGHSDDDPVDRFRDRQYDLLADHFRAHLDMPKLLEIAGISATASS